MESWISGVIALEAMSPSVSSCQIKILNGRGLSPELQAECLRIYKKVSTMRS